MEDNYQKKKRKKDRNTYEAYSSSNKKDLVIQWASFNQTRAYFSEMCMRYRRTEAQNWGTGDRNVAKTQNHPDINILQCEDNADFVYIAALEMDSAQNEREAIPGDLSGSGALSICRQSVFPLPPAVLSP